MMKEIKNCTKKEKLLDGFTIAELLVALAVFVGAVGLIVGVFTQALRTQRMVNALAGVNSNASLVVEQIAREIRLGWNFNSPPNLPGSTCDSTAGQYDTIQFLRTRPSGPATVTYSWSEADNSINRGEGIISPVPLTAANVDVSRLCFRVYQFAGSSPWRVTIFATFGSREPQLQHRLLDVQTTVSSRVLPEDI